MIFFAGEGWAFSIRELAQLWCRSQQQVRRILDEESIARQVEVAASEGSSRIAFKKTVVLGEDAVRAYGRSVFPSLPPHVDPLTPDEADFLFLVLGQLASDGALGTPKLVSQEWWAPLSQIQGDAAVYWVDSFDYRYPGADRRRVYRALKSFSPDRSVTQGRTLIVG